MPSRKQAFGWTAEQMKADTPDQDVRRQQLLEANQAQPRRQNHYGEEPAPKKSPSKLRHVLSEARPDWSAKELHAVQEKLKKIQIESKAELFHQLRTIGIGCSQRK